jgi:hypothetical protein
VNDRIVAAEAGMLARESRNPLATFNLGEAKNSPSTVGRIKDRQSDGGEDRRPSFAFARPRFAAPRPPALSLAFRKSCCHFGLCKPQAALLYAGRTTCFPVPR